MRVSHFQRLNSLFPPPPFFSPLTIWQLEDNNAKLETKITETEKALSSKLGKGK